MLPLMKRQRELGAGGAPHLAALGGHRFGALRDAGVSPVGPGIDLVVVWGSLSPLSDRDSGAVCTSPERDEGPGVSARRSRIRGRSVPGLALLAAWSCGLQDISRSEHSEGDRLPYIGWGVAGEGVEGEIGNAEYIWR